MTLNGIYWTAIVFGEVTGQVQVTGRVAIAPYQKVTGTVTVTGQVMPPRLVDGQLWVIGAASGQAASGPAVVAGVLTVVGAVRTYVTIHGPATVTGTVFGAAAPPPVQVNTSVQRASTF